MQSAGPGFVCRPIPPATTPERAIQNLITVAELWSYALFVHPNLAGRSDEWRAALLELLPAVLAAESDARLSEVVQQLLAKLDDPATLVRTTPAAAPEPAPVVRDLDGTLVVALAGFDENNGDVERVSNALIEAERVIFDLRHVAHEHGPLLGYLFDMWGPSLCGEPLRLPAMRKRLMYGFPSEVWFTSGQYYSAFEIPDPPIVRPRVEGKAPRIAFVVDDAQLLPAIAIPLVERGAGIVSASPLDDSALAVPHSISLPGGATALLRTSEPVYRDGRPKLDAIVTRGDPLVAAQASLARPPRARRVAVEPYSDRAGAIVERSQTPTTLPPEAERLLAVVDLWSTLDSFHAYPTLRPRWGEALAEALVAARAAQDMDAYLRALMRLTARVEDSHAGIVGELLDTTYGNAYLPATLRVIEGCLIITELTDAERGEALRVGDVILEIDGVPIAELFSHWLPLVAASRPNTHLYQAARWLSRGHAERPVELLVDRSGDRLSIAVTRSASSPSNTNAAPTWRELDGGIGYADLGRLQPAEVPAMFAALADTHAIIFDMRGYPNGTAWTIAPYLDRHIRPGRTRAAAIDQPLIYDGNVGLYSKRVFQRLPEAEVAHYAGRTSMLTDERTLSQAEHTGLFFAAANDTQFVGTPSAGTNGDITSHVLPHGLYVRFTGQAISHVDGRSLQRVGLPLALEVAPTIAGVRAGEDEVLAAALALLAQP
jgi:C-terminal processing protease CtpA/Prc